MLRYKFRASTKAALFVVASANYLLGGQLTLVEFSVTDLNGNFGGQPPIFGTVSGPISSSYTGSSTSSDGQYVQMYTGSATASYANLHAAASESVTCLLTSCVPYALPFSANAGSADYEPGISSLAWWDDVITVQPAPGLVALNFIFNVHGTFTQSGSGNASDTSAFLTGESCAATADFCHGAGGGEPAVPRHNTTVPLPANGTVTVNVIPWVIGQPFQYEFILGASAAVIPTTIGAQGYINGNSSASTDFSNTAQLIAVVPVDINGNPVTGTTVTSASGLPVPLATPEPSTAVLMAAGLVLLRISLGAKLRITYRSASTGSTPVSPGDVTSAAP
jgi:hypothetical protein